MKYSINGTGNIVAERDIYSLGGFIPKGTVGGKIASEEQLSQDGECWLASGNISARPDVRIKDNAYIGTFNPSAAAVHTDGVTEFSGDTLIPGVIIVRNPIADPVNNFFAKDSFIGVSMDVLCGPDTTTTAFPFVQGKLDQKKPAGTPTGNMAVADANACFSKAVLRPGKDTWVYVPTGKTARILWAYYGTENTTIYSGEFETLQAGIHKVSHHTYGVCFVTFYSATAMTPADLLASGAKILGHISSSVSIDIRPESASGQYVMDKSSLLMNTDNFGLSTAQLRFVAGGMYNTNMYMLSDSQDYKLFGTFHNVERLEYTMYLGGSHRTAANRDTYISAYDCPLLRVDNGTYDASLTATGDLTLRRCVVPKAEFQNDVINGNTYEDIDFSYANEDLGYVMTGYTKFISSHERGIYRLSGGPSSVGFVSHKGNLDATARLYQSEVYLPLDGNLVEQGAYGGGTIAPYEIAKSDSPNRVRTGKPLPTFGLVFPSLPAGYSVWALHYLDDDFIIRSTTAAPTGVDTTYPYVVMVFRKGDGNTPLPVNEFIALNSTLRIIDHTKAPEITGSAYVGAGCTVRGDVKLIGDPYVNRVFDSNMWERGDNTKVTGQTWGEGKNLINQERHFEFKEAFPVEAGGTLSAASGYFIYAGWMDENKRILSISGAWAASFTVPANARYAGLVLKKAASAAAVGGLIVDSDIPLANVKYIWTFEKRRYITNELDRTSPKDILLGPDMWEQGGLSIAEGNAGKPYEELKIVSPYRIRLKRPFGLGSGYTVTFPAGYSFGTTYYDAVTKLLYGSTSANRDNALLALVGGIADSPTAVITPEDVPAGRLIIEFTPTPRIVVPYGASGIFITGMKIRMYDNAVLSRSLNQRGEIVLRGDAVMGRDFNAGSCMCSNGHSDAIIKLP